MTHVPLIITGLHRSGTTWLGKIIEVTGQVPVLHEPLNIQHGISGVPCWYPYHPGGHPEQGNAPHAETVERLFADFFAGRTSYVREHPNGPLFRKVARRVMGSRTERHYFATFRGAQGPQVCLKDPFCLFSIPHLIERYNARVVVTIRHPAALLVSMRRMKWQPHIRSLQDQPGLLKRFGEGIPSEMLAQEDDDIRLNAYFWLVARRFTAHLLETWPSNVLLVRHEDMSLGQPETVERMISHFGLNEGLDAAMAYVSKTTRGETVSPGQSVLHDFSRDGAALVHYWKARLSSEEKSTLRDVVGDELEWCY